MFATKPALLSQLAREVPREAADAHAARRAGQRDLHLFFPPQWSPFQPFLSTPSLKAYLETRGFAIEQTDLNVGYYEHFISAARLPGARARLQAYLAGLGADARAYCGRAQTALAVLERHDALHREAAALRERETIAEIGRYRRSVLAFEALLDAFSVAEPVIDIATSSSLAWRVLSSWSTLRPFLDDESVNPFLGYYRTALASLAPARAFGISLISYQQIAGGLTLARALKVAFPDIPVIIGGSVFARLVEKGPALLPLFGEVFDYVCRYEGERPLEQFLAAPDSQRESVPNFCYRREDALVQNELCEPVQIVDLPAPDFSGMPLESYYSTEVVLPLLTARGCYYGKCAFCYHGMIYQNQFRMRTAEQVTEDVLTLSRRHRARHFAFVDEALPPKLFRSLPRVMPADRFHFTALYKFEDYFKPDDFREMHKIGFRTFYSGLESASERVQRHMKKNLRRSTMENNLRWAHEAGIWNHTFNFFGFPTETEAEARETMDFLLEHRDIIDSEGTGTFALEHNAPAHLRSALYGIRRVVKQDDWLFELYYPYEVDTGLNADGALTALQRFNELKQSAGAYQAGTWLPHDHLLLLVAAHGRDRLRALLEQSEAEAIGGAV